MTAYILIMMLWVPSHSGAISTAEFANASSCQAAGLAAKKEFDGWGNTLYFVCAPKDARSP